MAAPTVPQHTFDDIEKALQKLKKKDEVLFDNNKAFTDSSVKLRKQYIEEVQKHALLYIQYMRLLQSMRVQSKQREILMKKIDEEAPYMEDVIKYMN
jgi:hypothetical protein